MTGTGPAAGLAGGLAGLAIGHEVSPEVNGGGWGNLGSSGQGNYGDPGNLSEGGNGNGGLGGAQVALGQTQAGATQPTQTATQASTYQARVPVELWAELDPEKRAEAMAQFWSQF